MRARTKILAGLIVLLAAAAIGTIYYLRRPAAVLPPPAEARLSPELELLTILGDVANKPRPRGGRWRTVRAPGPVEKMSRAEREKLSRVMTLPYLQGYKEAPEKTSVIRYRADAAYRGVNAYTSGHAPEAFLMDMRGNILHRWRFDVEDVWPDVPHTIHSTFWRRVHWFPNGDVLAIFEGIGMIKLDRHSRLLWAYRGGCHHEAFVTGDGSIYVLTRRARRIPRINPDRPVLPDAVTVLSPDGEVRGRYSLLECFENSEYRGLLSGMRREGDLFHTNTIFVFDGSKQGDSPLFKKGNVLVSMLKLDTIAIVDLDAKRVVWAQSGDANGMWKRQHDPSLLENGDMMLFDNRGNNGASKVIEFDPATMKIVWQYAGRAGDKLFSKTCGTAERLPNGNTLITESDNGRALEVTRSREVVWEFLNPHRAGERHELIATLFELKRFDADYFPWLKLD